MFDLGLWPIADSSSWCFSSSSPSLESLLSNIVALLFLLIDLTLLAVSESLLHIIVGKFLLNYFIVVILLDLSFLFQHHRLNKNKPLLLSLESVYYKISYFRHWGSKSILRTTLNVFYEVIKNISNFVSSWCFLLLHLVICSCFFLQFALDLIIDCCCCYCHYYWRNQLMFLILMKIFFVNVTCDENTSTCDIMHEVASSSSSSILDK